MSHERAAAVRYLRLHGEHAMADAFERGEHRPPKPTRQFHHGTNRAWPCGHPRTDENTVRVGRENGVRCKTCRRAIGAAYRARQVAERASAR